MSNDREKFLLFRIRAFKDENAFATIVTLYKSKIERFLSYKLPSGNDVEDAAGETWIRLWSYVQSSQVESLSGLVFTIARRVVADFYQKQEHIQEQPLPDNDDAPELSDPLQESIINQVDASLLKRALGQLKDEESQLIFMRHVEQLRVKEMAKRLSLTENVVSVRLHRAINKLRSIIKDTYGDL